MNMILKGRIIIVLMTYEDLYVRCVQVLEYYRTRIFNCLRKNKLFEFRSCYPVTTIKIIEEFIPSGCNDNTHIGSFGYNF